MRFSAVFSVLACGTMALAAAVSPAALVSRSNADISAAMFTLDGVLDAIYPKLDACKNANCTQELVLDICGAIDEAEAAIIGFEGIITDDISNEIAKSVIDISYALDAHSKACDDKCGDLSIYGKVNVSLSSLLEQLEVCIPGILASVKPLVAKVISLLVSLGLTAVVKLFA